jgi:competence protein ComEA
LSERLEAAGNGILGNQFSGSESMKARFLSFAMAALLCTGLALAKVNVNTATPEELDTLYGIGEARAKAIVAYRQQHGPFKSLRDLEKVPELPESVVKGLKGKVSFSGPTRIDAADGASSKASDKKAAPEKAARTDGASAPAKPMSLPAPSRNETAPAGPAKPAAPGKPAAPAPAAAEKPAMPASPAKPAGPAKPMLDGKAATPVAPAAASLPAGGVEKPAVPAAPAKPAAPASPAIKPAAPAAATAENTPAPAAPAKPAGPAKPAVPASPAASY